MAVQYVNNSTYTRVIGSPEPGLNIRSITTEVSPEVDDYLKGRDDQAFCFAVGDPMADITIEGEMGSGGITTGNFYTAYAPANTINYYGRSQGGCYPKKVTVKEDRGAWKDFTANFKSYFNVP